MAVDDTKTCTRAVFETADFDGQNNFELVAALASAECLSGAQSEAQSQESDQDKNETPLDVSGSSGLESTFVDDSADFAFDPLGLVDAGGVLTLHATKSWREKQKISQWFLYAMAATMAGLAFYMLVSATRLEVTAPVWLNVSFYLMSFVIAAFSGLLLMLGIKQLKTGLAGQIVTLDPEGMSFPYHHDRVLHVGWHEVIDLKNNALRFLRTTSGEAPGGFVSKIKAFFASGRKGRIEYALLPELALEPAQLNQYLFHYKAVAGAQVDDLQLDKARCLQIRSARTVALAVAVTYLSVFWAVLVLNPVENLKKFELDREVFSPGLDWRYQRYAWARAAVDGIIGKPPAEDPSYADMRATYLPYKYTLHGQNNQTAEAMEKLIGSGEGGQEVYYICGNAYVKMDKFAEAIACFTRGLAIDPRDAELHESLSYAMYKSNQYKQAIEESNKSLQLAPDLIEPHIISAVADYKLGDFEQSLLEADKAFSTFAKIEKNKHKIDARLAVWAYVSTARTLCSLGRMQEACDCLTRAIFFSSKIQKTDPVVLNVNRCVDDFSKANLHTERAMVYEKLGLKALAERDSREARSVPNASH